MDRIPQDRRVTAALLFSLILFASGCGSSTMKTPDIKLNPHPKMRYEITIIIKDAPGSFDSMRTIAQYDIENDRCVPLTPGSGATIAPDKTVDMPLVHVGDNTYRGELYTDLVEDADYYGLGVCHWKMTAVSAYLQVKKTTITTGISLEDLLAQKPSTGFFSNQNFTDSKLSGVDIGDADKSSYKNPADTFSITFTAKEKFQ